MQPPSAQVTVDPSNPDFGGWTLDANGNVIDKDGNPIATDVIRTEGSMAEVLERQAAYYAAEVDGLYSKVDQTVRDHAATLDARWAEFTRRGAKPQDIARLFTPDEYARQLKTHVPATVRYNLWQQQTGSSLTALSDYLDPDEFAEREKQLRDRADQRVAFPGRFTPVDTETRKELRALHAAGLIAATANRNQSVANGGIFALVARAATEKWVSRSGGTEVEILQTGDEGALVGGLVDVFAQTRAGVPPTGPKLQTPVEATIDAAANAASPTILSEVIGGSVPPLPTLRGRTLTISPTFDGPDSVRPGIIHGGEIDSPDSPSSWNEPTRPGRPVTVVAAIGAGEINPARDVFTFQHAPIGSYNNDPTVIADDVPANPRGMPTVFVRFQHATFPTLDDAMRDALMLTNPASIERGRELSGQAFVTPDGRYGYTGPVEYSRQALSRNESDPAEAPIHPEWGESAGADYHAHGNYVSAGEIYQRKGPTLVLRPNTPFESYEWRFPNGEAPFRPDEFSRVDTIGGIAMSQEFGGRYARYLGTPSGALRVFEVHPDYDLRERILQPPLIPPLPPKR